MILILFSFIINLFVECPICGAYIGGDMLKQYVNYYHSEHGMKGGMH